MNVTQLIKTKLTDLESAISTAEKIHLKAKTDGCFLIYNICKESFHLLYQKFTTVLTNASMTREKTTISL